MEMGVMAGVGGQLGVGVKTQIEPSQNPSLCWGSTRKAPRNGPRENELAGDHPPSFQKILAAA